MTEPRKAAAEPPLALYALAQARASEVQRACGTACKDCAGPAEPGGCETRKWPQVVAGKADWPMCPLGMLRTAAWRALVERYLAAKIAPIQGWPNGFSAWAYDAMLELHMAVREEDERKVREASGSSGGPNFSGRRASRGRGEG